MRAVIETSDLGVRFDFDRQRRVVTPALRRMRRKGESVWGLRAVDFSVGPGESVALVGPSGSGKTSLLRAIAGILPADTGSIDVNGRVGSLLAVEGGLLGALTGRENARTLTVLAGLSRSAARVVEDEIGERARLANAFDRPVGTYSEGMRARLGFAIAESAKPSIVVLDEVFEALDHEYRLVVEDHTRTLTAEGGIVVVAGHDYHALTRMCSRAIRLSAGRVIDDGPIEKVLSGSR